jgi:hypothetical protein
MDDVIYVFALDGLTPVESGRSKRVIHKFAGEVKPKTVRLRRLTGAKYWGAPCLCCGEENSRAARYKSQLPREDVYLSFTEAKKVALEALNDRLAALEEMRARVNDTILRLQEEEDADTTTPPVGTTEGAR